MGRTYRKQEREFHRKKTKSQHSQQFNKRKWLEEEQQQKSNQDKR